MKIKDAAISGTKLCHARPGDVVRLLDSDNRLDTDPCLVVIAAEDKVPSAWRSQGLYDCGNQILLIDLQAGAPIKIRSLSQRCVIYRNAELILGATE